MNASNSLSGNSRRPAPRARQAGFSIVEILVALVAGMILSLGIGEIFLSTGQSYRGQDQSSRLQENGRYALEAMMHDIRMAGALGCSSRVVQIDNTLKGAGTLYYNFATPVEGFEATGTAPGNTYSITSSYPSPTSSATAWTPSLPEVSPAVTSQAIAGTDILVVRGRQDLGSDLAALDKDSPAQLTVAAGGYRPAVGDIAMAADCKWARVFRVTAATAGGVVTHALGGTTDGENACASWLRPGDHSPSIAPCVPPHNFPTTATAATLGSVPAEVSAVATSIYFISQRDRTGMKCPPDTPDPAYPCPPPSLYKRVGTGNKQELVEGVESMQILYEVVVNPPPNPDDGRRQFVTANDIAGRIVTGVRIGLLLRTLDEMSIGKDTRTYDVNGTTIDPVNDRRLRRVITTTVGVRNEFQ